MTTKQLQSQSELTQHLQDHIGFLQASSNAYDQGFDGEAKRLAVSIRVLVHDTNSSKSLLGQLDQKNNPFFDSALPIKKENKGLHIGLVIKSLSPSQGARYIPFLDDIYHGENRTIDFDTWWNSTVFIDSKGQQLGRKDIVLAVANQDGGAHVDPSLNQAYADLSRNNSLGWVVSDGKTTEPMEGPELATIRQIAHELLKSLLPGYAKNPVYPFGARFAGITIKDGDDNAIVRTAKQSPRKKVGRNDSCPCGSGNKFKRCCGKLI